MPRHNNIPNIPRRINNRDLESLFEVNEENGECYYDFSDCLFISEDVDPRLYVEHTFRPGESWYALSNRYYGNIDYYWLILIVNHIDNPFEYPTPGTILKIPTAEFATHVTERMNDRRTL